MGIRKATNDSKWKIGEGRYCSACHRVVEVGTWKLCSEGNCPCFKVMMMNSRLFKKQWVEQNEKD